MSFLDTYFVLVLDGRKQATPSCPFTLIQSWTSSASTREHDLGHEGQVTIPTLAEASTVACRFFTSFTDPLRLSTRAVSKAPFHKDSLLPSPSGSVWKCPDPFLTQKERLKRTGIMRSTRQHRRHCGHNWSSFSKRECSFCTNWLLGEGCSHLYFKSSSCPMESVLQGARTEAEKLVRVLF